MHKLPVDNDFPPYFLATASHLCTVTGLAGAILVFNSVTSKARISYNIKTTVPSM